jgi:shikimate dehydrogenase
MRMFGLIGFPLSHSFSQKYFTEKFQREHIAGCAFTNFSLENINDFPALIKSNPTLIGLSVTIPHKKNVMQFLNHVDAAAKQIGAVNCVRIDSDRKLSGYNTDVVGFEKSLTPLLKSNHTQALILGTGGAAKAVAYILNKLKIKFKFVSRNEKSKARSGEILSYADVNQEMISNCTLLINTTPLGMFPNLSGCPDILYEFITPDHLLYDLTYNPEESLFLKKGKENGAQIKNGLEMLHIQAEKAWEIWNS